MIVLGWFWGCSLLRFSVCVRSRFLARRTTQASSAMPTEDVKLEAWQAAVSPKLDCCTEPTLKASGLTVGSLVVYVKRKCCS